MNRREMLMLLRNFCILNGIQNVLSPESFGATLNPKKRLINFVIKYTGGATEKDGLGKWTFDQTDSVLAPLKAYQNDMAIPLGLDCKFNIPMNSHASPQISALTGAMTGYEYRLDGGGTVKDNYPSGNLQKYSTGDGKSIDVLIGEKLMNEYKTQIPNLQISSYAYPDIQAAAQSHSSWGAEGKLLPSFTSVNSLSNELKNRIQCNLLVENVALKTSYQRKLAALEYIKKNQIIFDSKYVIDKDKFANLQEKIQKSNDKVVNDLNSGVSVKPAICGNFPTVPTLQSEYINRTSIDTKLEAMYSLVIAALQTNVTRSITINLSTSDLHGNSHYIQAPPIDKYLDACRYMQSCVAKFLTKLTAAGLYDDTLIFCNAGSCMTNEVHNYENLSTYVINGDKAGVVGAVDDPKPVGSLLLDILHKFGITYSEYGGINHRLGVAKKGNFI